MQLAVLASLVALAVAAHKGVVVVDEYGNIIEGARRQQPEIRLLNQYFTQDGQGNYEYGYEQDNGQKVQEVGKSYPGYKPETGSISKEGSFEWVAPDYQKYRVDYVADEGGFQPNGAHLPQAPEQIPEYALLRAEHPELFVGAY